MPLGLVYGIAQDGKEGRCWEEGDEKLGRKRNEDVYSRDDSKLICVLELDMDDMEMARSTLWPGRDKHLKRAGQARVPRRWLFLIVSFNDDIEQVT